MRNLIKKIAWLGLSEGVSRLSNFFVLAGVARYLGIEAIGIYGLAQALSQYIIVGTDLGLKSIGAKVVTLYPDSIAVIRYAVQIKRLILSLVILVVGLCYAAFGPIPEESRVFVALFLISVFPHAFSLDWVLWGKENFRLLGFWRASIAFLYAALVFICIYFFSTDLNFVAYSNFISIFIGVVVLRSIVVSKWSSSQHENSASEAEVLAETNWSKVWILGLALMFNLLFHSVDVLMLGALSDTIQLGMYTAAYKIIFMLMGLFYLVNQAVFPTLVKKKDQSALLVRIFGFLTLAAILGLLFAVVVGRYADFVLLTLYGDGFSGAEYLFQLLLYVLPFDIVVSFLGSIMVAWGKQKQLLYATSISAIFNIVLNFYMIPHYGAEGAAWATLLSYCVILICLMSYFISQVLHGKKLLLEEKKSMGDV